MLTGVPQGSTFGPLLLYVFINDLCAKINFPNFLFAEDFKLYSDLKSIDDCISLQANIYWVYEWCYVNPMGHNVEKTKITSFTHNMNSISFNCYVRDISILYTDCIKDFGIMLHSKLHFHSHVDYAHFLELITYYL